MPDKERDYPPFTDPTPGVPEPPGQKRDECPAPPTIHYHTEEKDN